MTSPQASDALLGLYVDEALGRVATIVAALTLSSPPSDDELRWAAYPTHSLKGLTAQAGDLALAGQIHAIEDDLLALAATADPDTRSAGVAEIVTRLRVIEGTLQQRAAPALRTVDLHQIAASTADEIRRIATRRGITVGVDADAPEGVQVPRRIAGVLVDVLGHIVRNAVTHGTPAGGTIRLRFEAGADTLTVVVGNHGRGGEDSSTVPTIDGGRGLGLQAAQGRLMAIGGDLAVSSGAWGGTSVTVRIPLPAT